MLPAMQRSNDTRATPHFRTVGKNPRRARVFLHCSMCDTRLCEIAGNQRVSVRRGYYCVECQIDMGLKEAEK